MLRGFSVLSESLDDFERYLRRKDKTAADLVGRKLVGDGAQLRAFPRPVMEAALKAANELYDELSAKSPHWKRIYEQWRKFRADQFLWFRVAESSYDNFAFTGVPASERAAEAPKGAAKGAGKAAK